MLFDIFQWGYYIECSDVKWIYSGFCDVAWSS